MPPQRFCPGCGTQIESGHKYCSSCGAGICPVCSTLVRQGDTNCPRCNYLLGSASPGMTGHQPPTPPPSPRQFPSSQGGIIGPQSRQQPPYPQAPSSPMPGAMPGPSITQPMPPQRYGTADQSTGASVSPGAMPHTGEQQSSIRAQRTFVDTGPIRVRRFPPALVAILIIALIVLAGFAAFKAGWLEAPLNNIQELVSGIDLPQWLPFGSKDATPPVISEARASNITQTEAVITWKTDEPTTSQVMICEGTSCIPTGLDEGLVTDHSVNLGDLNPNTAYHFSITSKDIRKNEAFAEGDFTTLAQASVTTLVISAIQTSNTTDLSAIISWTTDIAATTQLEYGTTNAYGSTTTIDESLTTSHNVTLTGLKPITTYHFKVKSKDAGGEEVVSQDQTFNTLSTVSAATEIGPEVGKLAPDFTLPTLDGKQISLSEFRGKIVMVNFWQDVQQSRNELDEIQAVYDTWPRDKLVILAVSWKQSPQNVQTFLTSKPLTLPILLDETGEVAAKYNVLLSPATFFIDTQGVIRDIKYYPSTLKGVEQIEGILNSMQ